MPHHFNCCVPQCTNNFRNKPNLEYYRIPKCEKARKYYKVSLRNESLKLDSSQTRICSEHFEGGQKLSRNHLPTIFPWTKRENQGEKSLSMTLCQRKGKSHQLLYLLLILTAVTLTTMPTRIVFSLAIKQMQLTETTLNIWYCH